MKAPLRNALAVALVTVVAGLSACGNGSAPVDPEKIDPPGRPASPASAPPSYHESWEGTSTLSNPAADPSVAPPCPESGLPNCDTHRLSVPADVQQVLVAIKGDPSPAEDVQTNDFDLYVYDDQNNLIAYSATESGNESLVFDNAGAAYYEVRVASYLVVPGSGYKGLATAVSNRAANDASDCLEAVPESTGFAGVTDAGQDIDLTVHLLLDGTNPAVAQRVMAKAAESYKPLHINFKLQGMEAVSIAAKDSQGIIDAAKAYTGGRPPAGADVVVVFTNQEMQQGAAAGTTVIGQADCIGGIRFPQHAYAAVTDVTSQEGDAIAPGFNLNVDMGAETLAHEVGHLLGAQHHYGNCVEGNLDSDGPDDVSPCTLMFPLVNGASLHFGTLEGLVVRGHAVDYAAP